MAEARGHHFVSQFYLRGFTRKGGKKSKLFVVDLKRRRCFETVPSNVAKVRDFNRIEDRPPGEVEEFLSGFEAKADQAMRKILTDRNLADASAWSIVLELIALFAVRHPTRRESVRGWMSQVAKITMDLVTATPQRYEAEVRGAREAGYLDDTEDITFESMREFVRAGKYQITVPTSRHLQMEFNLIAPMHAMLSDRKWDLLLASDESGPFITSDRPVALFNCDGSEPSLQRPLGYGLPETAVYFPLSRSAALYGRFEAGGRVLAATERLVAQFNGVCAANATEQLFAASARARTDFGGSKTLFVADLIRLERERRQPAADGVTP